MDFEFDEFDAVYVEIILYGWKVEYSCWWTLLEPPPKGSVIDEVAGMIENF